MRSNVIITICIALWILPLEIFGWCQQNYPSLFRRNCWNTNQETAQIFPSTKSQIWMSSSLSSSSSPNDISSSSSSSGINTKDTEKTLQYAIKVCDTDDSTIKQIATFLIDSYWLGSSRYQTDSTIQLSNNAKQSLIDEQYIDLLDKYGTKLGQSFARHCLIGAYDNDNTNDNDLIGFVCMSEVLYDSNTNRIYDKSSSESMLKNAISSIGPKQRKQYAKSTGQQIANALLPDNINTILVVSNLCIQPNKRRYGIGTQLCKKVEQVVVEEWNYDTIYLVVESDNINAIELYQTKLEYTSITTNEQDTAIRLDTNKQEFIEIQLSTTLLMKKL